MGKKSNPLKIIEDVVKSTVKATGDTFNTAAQTVDDISSEVARTSRSGIHLDPNVKTDQAIKDADKADARQREQAISDQKEAASNLRRQEATSADASGGSTILLGKKGKKSKRGSSVSTGMGLSTGKTGLQS